ncbi:MAG: thioredoxin family protein [Rhodobacteraceae bacterium]|nr:thioredoxin family protein [Paracoccaceae bacterium]
MLRRHLLISAGMTLLARPLIAQEAVLGDDGLHKQPWFFDSFLELPEDLAEAAAEGKGLVVLFEQRGCPYCRELHSVNFARPEITDYMRANFLTVQLDLWGARKVLDFDGAEVEERDLAAKWGVQFTPTTVIFPAAAAGATSASEAEAFRMPGYLKPFHYLSSLEYVASGALRQKGFSGSCKASSPIWRRRV